MKTLIVSIALALLVASPAQAGCHIVAFNVMICDPDLSAPPFRGPVIAPRVTESAPPIVSAAYLAEACGSPDKLRQAGCAGFISGVANSYAYQGMYCLPANRIDVERSVIDYITRVPLMGLSATNMILEALKAQWPCRR